MITTSDRRQIPASPPKLKKPQTRFAAAHAEVCEIESCNEPSRHKVKVPRDGVLYEVWVCNLHQMILSRPREGSQNAYGKRPDGAAIRPDVSLGRAEGKQQGTYLKCNEYGVVSRIRPKPVEKKPPPLIPCARPACRKPFEPRRPNQKHCSEKCRKLAHIERHDDELREAVRDQAIQPLLPLLEEFAAAPEQLRALRMLMNPPADAATIVPADVAAKAGDEMYSRIATLAERAAVALADLRKKS